MSPTASWLVIGLVFMLGVWIGTFRYALSMRRIAISLEEQLAARQDIDADIQLGLLDTRWRRRQLTVINGERMGVFTRYGRKRR